MQQVLIVTAVALGVLLGASGVLASASSTYSSDRMKEARVLLNEIQPLTTEQIHALEAIESLSARLEFAPNDLVSHRYRAGYLVFMSRLNEAIGDLEIVLEAEPDDANVSMLLDHCLNTIVFKHYKEGRFDEGIGLLDRVIRLRPENQYLRLTRGLLFVKSGRYDTAIADFEFAFKGESDNEQYRSLLVRLYNMAAYNFYAKRTQLEKALDIINIAITLDPDDTFWLSTKAEILYAMGRSAEALPLIQRSLQDYPDHEEMLLDLVNIQASLAVVNQD